MQDPPSGGSCCFLGKRLGSRRAAGEDTAQTGLVSDLVLFGSTNGIAETGPDLGKRGEVAE